jgi:uncharacterized protein (TIGR02001 family)
MIKQSAIALAALAAGVSAQAQDAAQSDLSVTVDITYVSDYVFRGVQAGNASIQPSIEATYGDFYAGAWHTDELSNSNGNETYLYAGYGYQLNDTVSFDVGVTRYTYSGGSGGDSTEVFVGVKGNVLLSPSLYYFHDFDNEANILEASVGYSFPIDAISTSLDVSGKLGNVSGPGSDYTFGVVGVAVPYKLSETATLTAGVDYIINDQKTVAAFGNGDEDMLVGKVGLSIGF